MPARLSGSAPDSETSASDGGLRRISRSAPTASGSANCSPEKPATKRPPRISPRALEPAIDAQQLAPRRQPAGLALEQAPEHHAVAAQQRARDVLDGLGLAARGGCAGAARRPAPSGRHPPCRTRRCGAGAAPPVSGLRRSDGTSSARRPAKLSEVTRPSATSSASASSTWERSRPRACDDLVEERGAVLRA